MAAMLAQLVGSWLTSPGLLSSFILLLVLSIVLTALCSDCNRRSFELKDSEAEKPPSALIRVVKLEETRENPMIHEIRKDEKEFPPDENTVTPWRSHLGAPHTHTAQESHSEEETPVTPWRSHLGAPLSPGVIGSEHIYHTITEGRGHNDASSSPPANQQQVDRPAAAALRDQDRNSVYARVSKKMSPNSPAVHRGREEEKKEEEQEEEEEEQEEEASPPLPDRGMED